MVEDFRNKRSNYLDEGSFKIMVPRSFTVSILIIVFFVLDVQVDFLATKFMKIDRQKCEDIFDSIYEMPQC